MFEASLEVQREWYWTCRLTVPWCCLCLSWFMVHTRSRTECHSNPHWITGLKFTPLSFLNLITNIWHVSRNCNLDQLMWLFFFEFLGFGLYIFIWQCQWGQCKLLENASIPFTCSRAEVLKPSDEKTMVPVSSRLRLDMVRPWTHPFMLTLQLLLGLMRRPSFCHTPSTSAWDSSTSKDAVSRSNVSMSFRLLRRKTFLATESRGQEKLAISTVSPWTEVILFGWVGGLHVGQRWRAPFMENVENKLSRSTFGPSTHLPVPQQTCWMAKQWPNVLR